MRKNPLITVVAIFLAAAIACTSKTADDGYANVKDFGARGDGVTDDTEAIHKAIASLPPEGGTVLFPPGRYISGTIHARNQVTFKGHSGWGYNIKATAASTISPVSDTMRMLFNLTGDGAVGVRLVGLTLDGLYKGENMDGVYSKHPGTEQNIVFDDCQIQCFTGNGIRLDNCWVFAIRHCLIRYNEGAGIDGSTSYDGWIIDNQLTRNSNCGIYADESFSVLVITANRIEWNINGGICISSPWCNQITGNSIDRNFGPGIEMVGRLERRISSANTVTGNLLRRNGYKQHLSGDQELFSHFVMKNLHGTTVVGNTFVGSSHPRDQRGRPPSPGYGMILEDLTECVISNNSMTDGALFENILDRGGHVNCVIKDNPGSLRDREDWAMEMLKKEPREERRPRTSIEAREERRPRPENKPAEEGKTQ